MRKRLNLKTIAVALTLVVAVSCTKEETIRVEPEEVNFPNPFTNQGGGQNPFPLNIDSTSFLGIYNSILSVKCGANNGACHDGSFEPDFRTLFSAYNTTVLHTPIKNVIASIVGGDTTWVYPYRVTPGEPDISWLYHRITTDDEELGRMPLYDAPLSESQINNVRQWILDGAPDPFGNLPQQPAPEPQFFGMLAYENDVSGMRLDTIRANIFEPMQLPSNTQVQFWFGAVDYTQEGGIVFPLLPLGYNKYRITDQLFNVGGFPEQNMQVSFVPHMGPAALFGDVELPFYSHFTINTADYEPGTVYYIRVYLQGALQSQPTEVPSDGDQIFWHGYMSFEVQ